VVGIQDRSSPTRTLNSESHEALKARLKVWAHLLGSTPFTLSMAPPAHVEVTATADAMASKNLAGLGGAAFFPDGSQAWFQFQITREQAQSLWPWVGLDMRKHIAARELLAQFALSHCIVMHLPKCRGPITCHQGTANSAADAAWLVHDTCNVYGAFAFFHVDASLPHLSQVESHSWTPKHHCSCIE